MPNCSAHAKAPNCVDHEHITQASFGWAVPPSLLACAGALSAVICLFISFVARVLAKDSGMQAWPEVHDTARNASICGRSAQRLWREGKGGLHGVPLLIPSAWSPSRERMCESGSPSHSSSSCSDCTAAFGKSMPRASEEAAEKDVKLHAAAQASQVET